MAAAYTGAWAGGPNHASARGRHRALSRRQQGAEEEDGVAKGYVQIDKKPFSDCTSPKKYKKLKIRKHRFRVQATDPKGNVGPIESFRWRVVD